MVHDKGLSTTIDWKDRDANGNMLSAKQRRKMSRLRTWDERARAKDSQERNLKQALGEIERMASALGIPENVREMASVIYRRCLDEDLLRGRCIESMTTASLYAAARQAKLPRSMDEFIQVARIEEQPIARAYRYISRELNLKVEPPTATDYIPKVSSNVDASNDNENLAEDLLQTAIEAGEHSGKHPNGLAAAALYAADLLNGRIDELTQAELAETADVCEVTIRNRHREILEINNKEPRLASPGTVKSA
jgi:transcription initiation factor TFIIB